MVLSHLSSHAASEILKIMSMDTLTGGTEKLALNSDLGCHLQESLSGKPRRLA